MVSSDDPEDPFDIGAIEEAVLYGLTLVSVTTSHDDNVHRMFDSLNNTDLRLSEFCSDASPARGVVSGL